MTGVKQYFLMMARAWRALVFLVPETEHPVIAVHDLPVVVDLLPPRRYWG